MTSRPALGVAALVLAASAAGAEPCAKSERFTILVHTGSAELKNPAAAAMLGDRKKVIASVLEEAGAALKAGGSALDAVELAVRRLEDSGKFNAGKGAIQNKEGDVELDASIMEGAQRRAGAVAAVRAIKNPIAGARAVMEKSEHVMFVGAGADRFAAGAGVETAAPGYFTNTGKKPVPDPAAKKSGTVGAVALDRCGNLAAGTSTGGYTVKTPGRVGDSPVIGAGTYAANETCAVSATGHGEYFIRWAVARDISARMEHRGESVAAAAAAVIDNLDKKGGKGGVIALDAKGNMAWPFSSSSMLRGYLNEKGGVKVGYEKEL